MAKIESENGSEQTEQATHTFRQTEELAEGLKMRPLLAHCCLELGKIYTRSGETEKARSELVKASGLYRSLSMGFWQLKADAILDDGSKNAYLQIIDRPSISQYQLYVGITTRPWS